MKFLLDLLPVFLFFVSFKWAEGHKAPVADWMTQHLGFLVSGGVVGVTEAPVLLASTVVVLGTLLQIIIMKSMRKHIDKMLWASLAVVVILGGLTLWFHSETFIKWKPTIVYWMMGGGLLIGEVFMKRDVLSQMMGGQIEVPEAVWRRLTWAWVTFFLAMGVLNLYVAFNFSTDTWVTFKMWGTMALLLVFALLQGLYLSRHMQPAAESQS
ncbi:septation protein A [Aquabacterium sp.]|uniref:septation protein A n=1 Tax=Aquabacterium sp. TaxID=1872578 RepID=UPI002E38090A|nr:septation protein A [Aquabacterium sp.]HEX5311612.1 septation protein A [Aquabacterium sp.]